MLDPDEIGGAFHWAGRIYRMNRIFFAFRACTVEDREERQKVSTLLRKKPGIIDRKLYALEQRWVRWLCQKQILAFLFILPKRLT